MSNDKCRVSMLTHDEAIEAATQAGVPEGMARLSIFQILLSHPTLAKPFNDWLLALLFKGLLSVRLRELVILRTGWVTNSVYEWTQHYSIAQMLGVDKAAIEAVRDWEKADQGMYSPQESAVLRCVDEYAQTGSFSVKAWEEMSKHFESDQELVELVMLIVTYSAVSGFLRNVQVPLEPGVDPWPPQGQGPEI